MKVRDLIETLSNLPEGADVYLAGDAEGNQFALLDGFDVSYASKTDAKFGRVDGFYYDEDLEDWDAEERDDLETVVVLWPV